MRKSTEKRNISGLYSNNENIYNDGKDFLRSDNAALVVSKYMSR